MKQHMNKGEILATEDVKRVSDRFMHLRPLIHALLAELLDVPATAIINFDIAIDESLLNKSGIAIATGTVNEQIVKH